MGFWSKFKKRLKQAWRLVKAVVRAVVRVVVEIVYRVVNALLFWLPIKKKMRLQILILEDENGRAVVKDSDLTTAVDFLKKTLNDKFDVKLKFYGEPGIQTLTAPAPKAALDVECGGGAFSNEFGEAGEYFANHLAAWNVIPLHLGFPITAFIVRDISGKIGCSLGPLADYVTVSTKGAFSDSTLSHEIGHCCGLLHRDNKNNLMFPDDGRGNSVTGWQKFVVRNSRHCTFW